MAFGAASFDATEAIAIANAARLAQKQKEAAERVASACGTASSSGQGRQDHPNSRQPGNEKKERKDRKEKKERKERKERKESKHRAGRLEGSRGASSSSSSSEDDEDEEIDLSKFVGAQKNFALQRRPRSNSPLASPPDARKAARELGLRLCRRGRRAALPQPAEASSPASDLAACFPKPGETWAPQFAGEGGRAPVLPEMAEAAPPEWRQGLPSTRHRLGVPPLRCRGPDAASKQGEKAESREGEREKEERSWSRQSLPMSQDMWFGVTGSDATPGVAPFLRYRPQSKAAAEFVPQPRSGHGQAEHAPRKPGASVAGQTMWHWEREKDELDRGEAVASEPAPAAKSLPETAMATTPDVNDLAKAVVKRGEAPVQSSLDEHVQEIQAVVKRGEAPVQSSLDEDVQEIQAELGTWHLEVGDRVAVAGLRSRPEMNGMLGTLVKMKDEQRWQVVMDEDFTEKIFKAKNLERVSERDGPEEVD